MYIKLDAKEQLLLSEGVCRQLSVICYHPDIESWKHRNKRTPCTTTTVKEGKAAELQEKGWGRVVVPTVSVKLIQALRLPAGQCSVVQVQLEGEEKGRPLLFEADHDIEQELGLELSDILLQPTEGTAQMVVANNSGFTKCVHAGTTIGEAVPGNVVDFSKLLGITKCMPASLESPMLP